jgi:2-polyprenyl-6-methoxyphenol hydroxylase-like FAD-dependent oxidoreductase
LGYVFPFPRAAGTPEEPAADMGDELVHHVEFRHPLENLDEAAARIALVAKKQKPGVVLHALPPGRPALGCEVHAVVVRIGPPTEPRRHEPMAGRLDRLRRRFTGFGGIVEEYLAALESDEQIHCGPVDWIALEKWHSSRVVLIGDAAHTSSPMMGQGGCMAMEDAWVLAESLGRSATLAEALERYSVRRRPGVNWVHQQSDAVAQSFRLPSAMRNDVLRRAGEQMFKRRFAPLLAAL